jgi:hypothetical protein
LSTATNKTDEVKNRRTERELANLDQGAMWPSAFALKELAAAEEARIAALVKKAVS